MRYSQILLEYDQKKTLERYGEKFYAKLQSEGNSYVFPKLIAYAKKQAIKELTKNNVDKNSPEGKLFIQNAIKQHISAMLLTELEEADPTTNKEYVPWLLTRYLNDGIKRFEDALSTASDALVIYDRAKRGGYFKRATDPAIKQLSDIGQFKTLDDLWKFVKSIKKDDLISKSSQEEELIKKNAAEILYNDPKYKIVKLNTEEASKFYGRNTKWCTAAERNNMFERYNRFGPLIVLLDKPNNRRWQFHFQEGQFMDEADEPYDLRKIDPNVWTLIDWKPYMAHMTFEGLNEVIKAWPIDDLEWVLDETDRMVAINAFMSAINDEPRREIIRNYIKTNFTYDPPNGITIGEFNFKFWKGYKTSSNEENMLTYVINNDLDKVFKTCGSHYIEYGLNPGNRNNCSCLIETPFDDNKFLILDDYSHIIIGTVYKSIIESSKLLPNKDQNKQLRIALENFIFTVKKK